VSHGHKAEEAEDDESQSGSGPDTLVGQQDSRAKRDRRGRQDPRAHG
jgi:hypothetical protein